MDQQGNELSDMAVVLLSEAIIRRAALDLWAVARPSKRKPHRHIVWIPGPDGKCIKRKETDKEYDIRLKRHERERLHKCRQLEHWLHSPYAKLMFGCSQDCRIRDVNSVTYFIKAIKHKADDGDRLFALDEDTRRKYHVRQYLRLKS